MDEEIQTTKEHKEMQTQGMEEIEQEWLSLLPKLCR
jgi:hypothetical protein